MRPTPYALRLAGLPIGLALAATLTGCPAPENQDGPARLRRFESQSELLSYFRKQVNQQRGGLFGLPRGFAQDDLAGAPEPAAEDNDFSGGGDAPDFTGTNIQETGVDESDFVKFDGEFMYIGRGETVRIVRAVPADNMAEIARVDVGARVSDLYLFEDRLIVFSHPENSSGPGGFVADIAIWPPYYADAEVTITGVDVSDPAAPVKQESVTLDGSVVSSRLTNGRLLVVLTIQPNVPDPLPLVGLELDDVLPERSVAGAAEPLVPWENWYRPEDENGYLMTAIVTLDAADVTEPLSSTAIMAGAGTIYASPTALYVTDTEYDASEDLREETDYHKFALNEQGIAEYVASGSTPGRLLNQFSLSEHEGRLRVATHVENFSFFGGDDVAVGGGGNVGVGVDAEPPADDVANSPSSGGTAQAADPTQPYNAVYVLEQSGEDLNVIGEIENIAPGETLYSARFIGERGFLVTFERIDPLFTVDLSQPSKPVLRGELKVPGFSDYLHPYGENYLIGIGRSTEEAPWGGIVAEGVQLSLFDVSDLDNPKAIQQIKVGGSGSMADASYDHKAFAFLESNGLLALPATLYPDDFDWNDWEGDKPWPDIFSGVAIYQVDPATGFTAKGEIGTVNPSEYGYYYSGWRRAAISGETIYALTEGGIRAAPLDAMDEAYELQLED